MFKPGDKVRITSGFYKDMEGYVEGIKYGEKNSHTVALKNDNGHVHTKLPPERIVLIKCVEPNTKEVLTHIESLLSEVGVCLNSIAKQN